MGAPLLHSSACCALHGSEGSGASVLCTAGLRARGSGLCNAPPCALDRVLLDPHVMPLGGDVDRAKEPEQDAGEHAREGAEEQDLEREGDNHVERHCCGMGMR